MPRLDPRWALLAAALIAALAAVVGIPLIVDDDEDPPRPQAPPVTISVPGAPSVVADRDQQLEPAERRQAADPTPADQGPDVHEDQVDEFSAGVNPDAAENGLQQTDAPGKAGPRPAGGAQGYSCRYKPAGNQSSRAGQKVLLGVLHYTVSPNRPGWSDVNAIWGLFNTRSFAASSTYIMDFEGLCLRLMSEGAKPWTQGNFNGRSVSIEVIATGGETRAQWLAAPIFAKGILAALRRDVLRRNGLPLRRVNPAGCTVQQAGWTDHDALECGNDHHDVTPAFPYDVFQRQLTAGAITSTDRRTCAKLNAWRRAGRPHGGRWERNSIRRRRALERRHVACTAKGPVRR